MKDEQFLGHSVNIVGFCTTKNPNMYEKRDVPPYAMIVSDDKWNIYNDIYP